MRVIHKKLTELKLST